MGRLDLFALAQANEADLALRLEEKRRTMSEGHATLLGGFCRAVQACGAVSINMRPAKLCTFLRTGRYLSVREVAAARAAASGRSAEDELRLMQGAHYERRILFEGSFEDGDRFLYGALNIGGAGATYYGQFCIVLGDQAMQLVRSAYLPDNSLDRYVLNASPSALDEPGIRRDVAPPQQRHCLAGLKHADDIQGCDEAAWPGMICSHECFVEAIFVGDISPERVTEIRIKESEMQRLSDLAFDDLRGALVAADRSEVESFSEALAKLDDLGLSSRLVEV